MSTDSQVKLHTILFQGFLEWKTWHPKMLSYLKISGDSSRHPAGLVARLFTQIDMKLLQYWSHTLIFLNCSASGYNFNASPISLPLQRSMHSNAPMHRWSNYSRDLKTFSNLVPCSKFNPLGNGENRTSVEDLSSFLTAMDSCIAINKKASISLIKSSKWVFGTI